MKLSQVQQTSQSNTNGKQVSVINDQVTSSRDRCLSGGHVMKLWGDDHDSCRHGHDSDSSLENEFHCCNTVKIFIIFTYSEAMIIPCLLPSQLNP